VEVTQRLVDWLCEARVGRVLEVGAGIGNTARRLAARGFAVTALEPDPALYATLRRLPGIDARCESLLQHAAQQPYDAIIAESVLFQMQLPQVLAHAHALLRAGGYLGFIEAVWIAGITAAQSAALYEDTLRLFGLPVGSREPLTWADWDAQLRSAGFETVHAQKLAHAAAGTAPSLSFWRALTGLVRNPALWLWRARYRARQRTIDMPSGIQEAWVYLGRKVDKAPRAPPVP
jgi:protein-L-isoaspartate O-methyltransferase